MIKNKKIDESEEMLKVLKGIRAGLRGIKWALWIFLVLVVTSSIVTLI